MAFDTHKERNADDREFAENRRALDEKGDAAAKAGPENRAEYPRRKVHREAFDAGR
jgi:hypothetical protein